MMKVHKNHTTFKKMTKEDDSYVNASPQDRLALMWEITSEIWALKNKTDVERRLQRNITRLIKK
jgi:hypothetical protein